VSEQGWRSISDDGQCQSEASSENAHPFFQVKGESSKARRRCSDVTECVLNQTVFEAVNLDEILGDRLALSIESFSFANPSRG
jgi:hypothetical protein